MVGKIDYDLDGGFKDGMSRFRTKMDIFVRGAGCTDL
jgi:hypothetical protein